MVQNYTKTDSWFQKSHEEFGQLQTSSGKPKKSKFDGHYQPVHPPLPNPTHPHPPPLTLTHPK